MPTAATSRREELELRQLELQVMTQELAVLVQQIHAAEQATRAFQGAQRRDWELRAARAKRAHAPHWVSIWIGGVAVSVTTALLFSLLSRSSR